MYAGAVRGDILLTFPGFIWELKWLCLHKTQHMVACCCCSLQGRHNTDDIGGLFRTVTYLLVSIYSFHMFASVSKLWKGSATRAHLQCDTFTAGGRRAVPREELFTFERCSQVMWCFCVAVCEERGRPSRAQLQEPCDAVRHPGQQQRQLICGEALQSFPGSPLMIYKNNVFETSSLYVYLYNPSTPNNTSESHHL